MPRTPYHTQHTLTCADSTNTLDLREFLSQHHPCRCGVKLRGIKVEPTATPGRDGSRPLASPSRNGATVSALASRGPAVWHVLLYVLSCLVLSCAIDVVVVTFSTIPEIIYTIATNMRRKAWMWVCSGKERERERNGVKRSAGHGTLSPSIARARGSALNRTDLDWKGPNWSRTGRHGTGTVSAADVTVRRVR